MWRERERDYRNYGGGEIPWYAVCKLENQESWGYNSVPVQRPEIRETDAINARKSLKANTLGEPGTQTSKEKVTSQFRRKEQLALPPPFCSIQPFDGLEDTHSHWQGHLLNSVYQFKCLSLLEIPLQTHLEKLFYQHSGHSLAQSSYHIKLTNIRSLITRSQAIKNNLNSENQGRRRNQNIWFHLVHKHL